MRNASLTLVILMLTTFLLPAVQVDNEENRLEPVRDALRAAGDGVSLVQESEPNNSNTTVDEAYPGDVIVGAVDMWSDDQDWYGIWLEAGQTLLLTLSHASGDGVSMAVWDEEGTSYGASNPGKVRDTIFLNEEQTEMGGMYTIAINATMTEAGGGAYVLEVDAGYDVEWYAPAVGWYAAMETYDARGELMYTATLSDYAFAKASTSTADAAPEWTTGDYWNYSVSASEAGMGASFSHDEFHLMTVTGTDTVSSKACYTVDLLGEIEVRMDMMGTTMVFTDNEEGDACYTTAGLKLVAENLSVTSSTSIQTSGAMSDTSGREGCTDEFGEPDQDCDGVDDDWDDCPGTAEGATVDAWGCSDAQNGGGGGGGGQTDTDGDGIPDENDACPNDPSTAENDLDNDGCVDDDGSGGSGGTGGGQTDSDGDGVIDDDDYCPDTPAGESVDSFGCSASQGGGGSGGGGGGGMDCIPEGMDQSTTFEMDVTYPNGLDAIHFPLIEGTVWSQSTTGTGTFSMAVNMGGCEILSETFEGSDSLPTNHRHLNTQDWTLSSGTVTAHGIQVFAGREGNDDWATPDFTLLPSVPSSVAEGGLPFAAWVNLVGFNNYTGSPSLTAEVVDSTAGVTYESPSLSVGETGGVIVDTASMDSGDYVLRITASDSTFTHSVDVAFEVDNSPDFSIWTFDPWIVLPTGVPWTVPTPVFVEPVNGFGADVTLSVTVPEGVTATLDYARGTTPFMAVLLLDIPNNLAAGDHTVVVTGTSGSTVHSDEITISMTSLPEFSLEMGDREIAMPSADGTVTITGSIQAHNGLDLSLGGMMDIMVDPYNEAMLEGLTITWGTLDANGNLPFTVTVPFDANAVTQDTLVTLSVVALDGLVTHTASVAVVQSSSSLDGTATAATSDAVSTGDTTAHDGGDVLSTTNNTGGDNTGGDSTGGDNTGGDSTDDGSSSEDEGMGAAVMVGASIGVVGLLAGVAVALLKMRGGDGSSDKSALADGMWQESMVDQGYAQPSVPAMQDLGAVPAMTTPVQAQPAVIPTIPAVASVEQQAVPSPANPAMPEATPAAVESAPVAPAPPAATAPPPPQPAARVADYTGLPSGGSYDQSTGVTLYNAPDGSQWQMLADGGFLRL